MVNFEVLNELASKKVEEMSSTELVKVIADRMSAVITSTIENLVAYRDEKKQVRGYGWFEHCGSTVAESLKIRKVFIDSEILEAYEKLPYEDKTSGGIYKFIDDNGKEIRESLKALGLELYTDRSFEDFRNFDVWYNYCILGELYFKIIER